MSAPAAQPPGFPRAEEPPDLAAPALAARGLALRDARLDDLPALADLYASTRDEELAPLGWPEQFRRQFLDQQFQAQHRHYVTHYPQAGYWVLAAGAQLAGRLYVQRAAATYAGDDLVIDISLAPALRGGGLGSVLLTALQQRAGAAGRGLSLSVHVHNTRAQRLYRRLGFALTAAGDTHLSMRWQAQQGVASPE